MLLPSPQHLVAAVLTTTALIPSLLAAQVPIRPGNVKKNFDIPSIGLGLWNSKDEDVSPYYDGLFVLSQGSSPRNIHHE